MTRAQSRAGQARALAATVGLLAAVASLPATSWAGAAAASAPGATVSAAAAPPAAWRQQFDDPVLTSLLAALPPQDNPRALALARQWVAVRVFHAQWSAWHALAQMAQDTQAALMDQPADTDGRAPQLARVASQLEQARQLAAARAAQRDAAIDAVARLSGIATQALVTRIGQPLTEWRLPHLVAEPPTVRLTVSPATSTLAQRLTDLHACHEAALQADRAALAARERLAQVQAQARDDAAAQAWQNLLLALSAQAGAAGDLALAWLDYLATAPAAAGASAAGGSALGHTAPRTAARAV